jgi:error-prone DNA polymerase
MGWDNPPVPWQEFERRLSWRSSGSRDPGTRAGDSSDRDSSRDASAGEVTARRLRPVTRLPARPAQQTEPAWAELHCHSSYSFLDGASSPAELVAEALKLGLTALAITDHDGMYGVPQFAQAVTRVK